MRYKLALFIAICAFFLSLPLISYGVRRPLAYVPTGTGVMTVTDGGQDMVAGSIDISTAVTGTLPLANGGTGAASFKAARLTALDANHLHAWELNEASGASEFVDTGASSSKVNLTITDTTKIALGTNCPFGTCAMFGAKTDGTSTNAHGGAKALVSAFSDLPTSNFSLEVWARSSQVSTSAQYLFSCDFTAAGNLQYYIRGSASDDMATLMRATSFVTATSTVALHPTSKTAQTWHHYMFTYDGTNIRMYADGEIIKTAAETGSVQWSYTTGTAPQIVVGDILSPGSGFVGWMYGLRMSDIVRSQSYARTVYAKGQLY